MFHLRSVGPLCFGLLSAIPTAPLAAQEPVILARGGVTDWAISLPAGAGPVERFAAEELRKYVERMSGARLPDAPTDRHERIVRLGLRTDLGKVEDLPNPKPGHDGYEVLARSGQIWIAGENPRGVLYGVYDLLERLGCRWFVPAHDPKDPEVVPKSPDLVLPAGRWAESARVPDRVLWASSLAFEIRPDRALPQVDWAAKCRYNAISWQCRAENIDSDLEKMRAGGVFAAMEQRGLILHGPGHCFPYFLPTEKYFPDHPDWFGFREGKRRPHGGIHPATNFCMSHPEALETFFANVEAFAKRYPILQRLDLLSIDGSLPCECERCARTTSADLTVEMFNRLSERLEKSAPGVVLDTTVTYGMLNKPPQKAVPNGKWQGLFAHWGRGHDRSYGDPDYGLRADLDAWVKLFPRLWICPYYGASSHEPFNGPPYLHALEGDTAFFVDHKITGTIVLEFPFGFWWNCAFNLRAGAMVPYYHPAHDPRSEVRDFALRYFGATAGPAMAEVLLAMGENRNLEASYRPTRGEAQPEDLAFLAEMRGKVARAEAEAKDDPAVAYRLAKFAGVLDFLPAFGGLRAKAQAAQRAAGDAAEGKGPRETAERAIAGARTYVEEILAKAKTLEAEYPGTMEADWVDSWYLNRVYRPMIDAAEKKLRGDTVPPAPAGPPPPPGPVR